MWGKKLSCEHDVFDVFARYCAGKITHLPWSDTALSPETEDIATPLVEMNSAGFLTINSQPRVNAADSAHTKYGWGGKGGVVYQKAYVEFFASPERLALLVEMLHGYPNLSYMAASFKSEKVEGNLRTPCAVTWGVFPGKEILQPTVVDPDAFVVWKNEAFALWETQWKAIFDKSKEEESTKILDSIQKNYYLVSVVDNDFINGNIWNVFDKVINQSANLKQQKKQQQQHHQQHEEKKKK